MKSLTTILITSLIFCNSLAFAVEHKVDIKGMAFSPAKLTVAVGDTVTFTNQDLAPHSGTASNKSFDTGILNQGQSGTVEIAQVGNIDFFCVVHPSMKGKVTAKEKEAAANNTAPKKPASNSNY